MTTTSKAINLTLRTSALLLFPFSALADTVILNTGEKVDCTVIEETSEFIRIEFQVTPTITDERKIPVDDITKVIKLRPDERAYAKIKGIVPTPDRMSLEDYDEIINEQIRPFLTSHPGSPLLSEVKEIHATLVEERVATEGGSRKIKGEWISAQQYAQESYDLDAEELSKSIDASFERNRFIEGLRTFDTMENDFGASIHYTTAIGTVIGHLPKLAKKLDHMEIQQPLLAERRSSGLAALPDYDRSRSQRAIDDEIAKYGRLREDEKAADLKWRTVWEYDMATITEAKKTAEDELTRLQGLDLQSIASGNALAAKANESILNGNYETATKLIEQSREIGGSENYLAQLESNIAEQQAVDEANAAASAAAAAAERDTEKAMKAIAQGDATTESGDAPGTEVAAVEGDTEASGDAAALAAKKAEAKKKAAAQQAAAAKTSSGSSGGVSMFNKILMGLALLLVVVTAVALMQKKRSGGDASEEAEA